MESYTLIKIIKELNSEIISFLLRFYFPKPDTDIFINDVSSKIQYITYNFEKPIEEILDSASERCIALSSRVIMENGIGYIPCMDFQLSISHENTELITRLLRDIIIAEELMGGWLIQSNKSYHFIGKNIISAEKWIQFIGKTLLMRDRETSVPLVDDRYIGHSLYRMDSPIRISQKDEMYPAIIAEL